MKVLDAVFVTSAASGRDLPGRARPQIALVGRSNVGKSSLINALTRRKVARTSAAPGKTRLANLYRVALTGWTGGRNSRLREGSGGLAEAQGAKAAGPGLARRSAEREGGTRGSDLYLVDLPGYGYARGGGESAAEFARLAEEYFMAGRLTAFAKAPASLAEAPSARRRKPAPTATTDVGAGFSRPEPEASRPGPDAALLMVDSRHPGLESDLDAWRWLGSLGLPAALVATKIDKLGLAERLRALGEMERSFNSPVLPVSAATGEGMELLWKLIATLVSPNPNPPNRP